MVSSALAGGLLTATLLVGCGQAPTTSASDEQPLAEPGSANADSPCLLLDDWTVESLIGENLPSTEVQVPGGNLPACHFGDITDRGIQVAQMPAALWAESLPATVDAIRALPEGAVDPRLLAQIEDASRLIQSGSPIPDDAACGTFSRLLEVQGQAAGTTQAVAYIPDLASAVAVSGQQCVDGTYTSLLVGRPDVAQDPEIVDLVSSVLQKIG